MSEHPTNTAKRLAQRGLALHASAPRAPGKDPNRRRYHKLFKAEFKAAQERLRPLGGVLLPGEHDYEAFVWSHDGGLRLIFYPHKVRTTGNVHIRVRSVGDNQALLRKAIFALAENSCTFQYPMDRALHNQAVTAAVLASRPS